MRFSLTTILGMCLALVTAYLPYASPEVVPYLQAVQAALMALLGKAAYDTPKPIKYQQRSLKLKKTVRKN